MNGTSISTKQTERRLFAWIAAFIVLLVFAGFSRSWFLHGLFNMPAPSQFLRVHGVIMSGWIVIYFVQTLLVYTNRVALHRQFGLFGAAYAILIVAFGVTATFLSARREVRAQSAAVPSYLNVLGLELTQMTLFALFVFLAIWCRSRPATHKRLMLLATFCMLPNPIVRLFLHLGVQTNLGFINIWASLLLLIIFIDSIRNRRLHPAFATGGTTALALMYAAQFASRTPLWQHFASHIVA